MTEAGSPLAYPVAVGSCLIAAVLSGYWWLGNDVGALLMDASAARSEPWRLLTSTLLHANVVHLVFNVLWMYRFGTLLEARLGAARFGGLFVLLAAGSGAAEQALASDGGVGLSGVVYGLFGFLWVARRAGVSYASAAVDARTSALFVGWFFFCIAATYTGALAIANVAHGMGAVLGALVGVAAMMRRWRVLAALGTGLLVAGSILGAGPLRPYLNLSGVPLSSSKGDEADQALDAGRFDEALALYRAALEASPDDWRLWNNLGVAYDRLGRFDDAVEASRRAHELEGSHDTRLGLGNAHARLGYHLMLEERWQEAADAFTRAEEVIPEDGGVKLNLGACLSRLGRHEEAAAKISAGEALAGPAAQPDGE